MVFSYNDYQFHCLMLPLFVIIFFSAAMIYNTVSSLKEITKNGISIEDVFSILFFLIIWIFFLRVDGGCLLNGGMYLFSEKEADSCTVVGTIDEITYNDQYSFPNMAKFYKQYDREGEELSHIYGCKIFVDGLSLTIPQRGELNQGDRVSVTFLPKSKYVLEIEILSGAG